MDKTKDALINIYPNEFFLSFVSRIVLYSLISGLIFIVAGIILKVDSSERIRNNC